MRRCLTVLLLLFLPIALSAQSFMSRSEIGLTFGGMNYIGDLNNQSIFGQPEMAGGVLARMNLDDRWSVALNGAYGHLKGGNPDVERRRNLSFRSYLWEANLRMEFNFVPFGTEGLRFRTTPYIFCGLGFFCFNPTTTYTNPATGETISVELQPLNTEGQGLAAYPERIPYTLIAVSMPFGLGFKAALTKDITFAVEYGFRKTWTDYIDDVSTTYVGAESLGPGSLSATLADRSAEVEPGYVNAPGIKRGDDSLKDWYAYFNLSLSCTLDALFGWMRSKKCEIK